jgi:DNA-binding PadR family transcriptional regulator
MRRVHEASLCGRTEAKAAKPHDGADGRLPEAVYVILGYVGTFPDGVHAYRLGRLLLRTRLGMPLLRLGQLYRALHCLERAALVRGTVEIGTSGHERCRYAMTREGRAAFRDWLTGPTCARLPLRDQLLERLRFAEQLPGSVLRRLLDDGRWECHAERDALTGEAALTKGSEATTGALYALALEARLLADLRWLRATRRLLEGRSRCVSDRMLTLRK